MTENTREVASVNPDGEEPEEELHEFRRTRNLNLRIAADDDRVAVVPGVTPAPDHRFAHDHERRDLVEEIVQQIRAESRAVPSLMPTRVRRRGVKHRVCRIRQDNPPSAPKREGGPTGKAQQREPQDRVTNGRAVASLEKLAHLGAGHRALIPIRLGKSPFDRLDRILAGEAVIEVRGRTGEYGSGVVVVHSSSGFWVNRSGKLPPYPPTIRRRRGRRAVPGKACRPPTSAGFRGRQPSWPCPRRNPHRCIRSS